MLSRSGLSIRRFISQRRSRDNEGVGDDALADAVSWERDGPSSLKAAADEEKKSRSWVAPRGSKKEKKKEKKQKHVPKPIIVLRRSGSIHTISGPLPPLPDTPYSSSAASSLCSCDYRLLLGNNGNAALSSPPSGSRSPGMGSLCSARSRTAVALEERATTPPLPPLPPMPFSLSSARTTARENGPLLSPRSFPRSKDDIDSASDSGGSTLNLLEALSLEPEDQYRYHRVPSPKLQSAAPRIDVPIQEEKRMSSDKDYEDDVDDDSLSETVQRLIRETDAAFNAVGSALADIKTAASTPPRLCSVAAVEDSSRPCSPTFTQPRKAPSPTAQQQRQHLQHSQQPLATTDAKMQKPPRFRRLPLVASSPVRKASVTRAKRKRSTRKTRRRGEQAVSPVAAPAPAASEYMPAAESSIAAPASSNSPRRTLTDNVTELFHGRRLPFGRIEADEMLSPGQLQAMRLRRISRQQQQQQKQEEEEQKQIQQQLLQPPRLSSETTRTMETDGSDTPIEPFHLQDLPSRIGAAGVRLTVPSPVDEKPTLPRPRERERISPRVAQRGGTPSTEESGVLAGGEAAKEESESAVPPVPFTQGQDSLPDGSGEHPCQQPPILHESISVPPPPIKNPLRFASRKQTQQQQHLALYAIPEVVISSPEEEEREDERSTGGTPVPVPVPVPTREPPMPPRPTPPEATAATHGAENSTTTTTTTTDEVSAKKDTKAETETEHEPESETPFVYLHSTPYTLTAPSFRHGPIRLPRSASFSLSSSSSSSSSSTSSTPSLDLFPSGAGRPEDTLDWTAFQMAILGGAGDFFWADSVDYGRPRPWQEEEDGEAEELAEWFCGMGYEHGGLLVSGEGEVKGQGGASRRTHISACASIPIPIPRPPSLTADPCPTPSPTSSSCSSSFSSQDSNSNPSNPSSSVLAAAQSLPIPVAPEHPSGFWNEGPNAPDPARFYAGAGVGIRRWTVEGRPKRYLSHGSGGHGRKWHSDGDGRNRNRESIDSLPQSPMLELVVVPPYHHPSHDGRITAPEGRTDGRTGGAVLDAVMTGECLVPMGYNLGHDLGDFLRWEAENVCAAGFVEGGGGGGGAAKR